MALRELFRDLAQQMLTVGGIFENVPFEFIYAREENPDYDPVTGVIVEHETQYTVTGVKASPNTRSIDNVNVYPTDQWVYVAGKAFITAGLTVPSKPNDRVIIDGQRWNVVRISSDPVDAVKILETRLP